MEHLRSYEISIWTLQDSFITVLKPSNLEHIGQIVEPTMTLKDDGENKLSLKIPMYIENEKGVFEENPIWCNTINGTIISDLRKIKVIFNKKTEDEAVYEFIILNVEESHTGKKKYCKIDCEGLAFHELGRQGYNIALEGADEITIKQKEYRENPDESKGSFPQPTINYWADRVFENSNWEYSIQMDWSMHDGITHQNYIYGGKTLDSNNYSDFSKEEKDYFNLRRNADGLRRRDRIYRDKFVSSWKLDEENDVLIPESFQDEEELMCLVEGKESNRYNLSQTIAERFRVFCKYKYYYDDNYHIVKREAIFYNNFLNESEGFIDITYKYNTDNLSRQMDSSDLVTKMIVSPLTDHDMPSGEASIADALSNKSLENYILNFDYLHDIGTITDEQYEEVEYFEKKMHEVNEAINNYNKILVINEDKKPKVQAKLEHAKAEYAADLEQRNTLNEMYRNLMDFERHPDGIPVTNANPQNFWLIPTQQNSRVCYCNVSIQGIDISTLKLYWNYNTLTHELDSLVTGYSLEKDEGGNLIKINNISKASYPNANVIYATYTYRPYTHYENLLNYWTNMQGKAANEEKEATDELSTIEDAIEQATAEQNAKIAEKNIVIQKFERLMGPALREGTWKPEDEYADYGDTHEGALNLTLNSTSQESIDNIASFIWDDELFEGEQDLKFDFSIAQNKYTYPCFRITQDILEHFKGSNEDGSLFFSKMTFIYVNAENVDENVKYTYLPINSQMKIGAVRSPSGEIIPVLLLLDTEKLTDENNLAKMDKGFLATTSVDISNNQFKIENRFPGGADGTQVVLDWIIPPSAMKNQNEYKMVYPRLKINSNTVKSAATDIFVFYGGEDNKKYQLINYTDFAINFRRDIYYVTLKPHAVFNPEYYSFWGAQGAKRKIFTFAFSTSTSPTAIYLDAIEVLKENSYPKVSYEVDVMSADKSFIYNAYNRLGQIAHINDYELKFENVMGYISELDLDLDKPWQDKAVIKNYKTKFEDLFSTIIAQTEQMKKNSAVIGLAANAFLSDGTLNQSLLADAIDRISAELTTIQLPLPETEYLKYEPYFRSLLRQMYVEAGEVISLSQKSLTDLNNLNLKNADILGLYKENIKENLTPTRFRYGVFKENNREITYSKRHNIDLDVDQLNFKRSDVLEYGEKVNGEYIKKTYMATINSTHVDYGGDNPATSLKGWSLIKNGSLAQIKGASLNIDSDSGKINILAQNEINIESGGYLKLAGDNVRIYGNNSVQIGGPDVQIYSLDNNNTNTRGIHIFTSKIGSSSSSSAVDITGDGIVMAAADGITMKSGKGINFVTSDGSKNTTVLSINKDEGIYLGSNNSITFYSGNEVGNGASAMLSKDRILFGVSNKASGTAVDMTNRYILLTAGSVIPTNIGNVNSDIIGNNSGLYIDQSIIKMAAAQNGSKSLFKLTGNQLYLGVSDSLNNGSLITMNANGQVAIGTVNNVQQDSNGFKHIENTNARFEVYAPNFIVDSGGQLFANNAFINGIIMSKSGYVGGWSLLENKLSSGTGNNYVCLDSGTLGEDCALWAGNPISSSASFSVTRNGILKATGADIQGAITATSLTIGNQDANTWFSSNIRGIESRVGEVESKTSIIQDDNKIALTSINDYGNLAKITITDGYINLVSADGTQQGFNSSSIVRIGKDKIYLGTTGTFEVQSGNFKINSDGSVSVEGTINALNGSIGGWNIGGNYIGNGLSRGTSLVGMSNYGDNNSYAFWAGGTGSGDNLSSAKFSVTKSGVLTATEADIKGIIKADSGYLSTLNINGILTMDSNGAIKYGSKTSVGDDSNDGFYLNGSGYSFKTKDNNNRHIMMDINKNMFRILLNRNDNLGIGTILLGRENPNIDEQPHMSLFCMNYMDISSETINMTSSYLNLKTTVSGFTYRFCIYPGGLSDLALPNTVSSVIVIHPDGAQQEKTHTVTNADGSTTTVHDYYYRTCTVYEKW